MRYGILGFLELYSKRPDGNSYTVGGGICSTTSAPVGFFVEQRLEQNVMLKVERQDYQVMPPLSAEEYAELKEDIRQRGVMVPIEYDENGNVLDGHHRLKICAELGITDFPKVIRAGMTEEEKRTHARKLNLARRHLNREQKQDLIREQLRETPEKSDRQIASRLGVDHKTVSAKREELESIGEIPQCNRQTSDGRTYPAERKPVEPVRYGEPDDDEPEYYTPQNIPDSKPEEADNEKFIEPEPEHKPHVSNNSGNNEWYTPERYIELARDVLGEIDLDPASCAFANETVRAARYFSEENDGLCQEWRGRVWMNPPYSADLVGKFTRKFVDEYDAGRISEGIVLVNNATETAWFAYMTDAASAVVFTRGRIRYVSPERDSLAPLQGQAFIYFGNNTERFINVFSAVGWGAIVYDGTRRLSESEQRETVNQV